MSLSAELLTLPSDWRLVRVGSNKAPIAGTSWFDVDDYSPDDAASLNGSSPPAWGLKCGPGSGGVLVLDLDAPGWRESFEQVTGHPITDLPPTIGWTSGKLGRSGHAFTVDSDWWDSLANVRAFTRPWQEGDPLGPKGEKKAVTLWELRWNRVQSVILGAHPETGAYRWLPDRSPADIPDPAPAPDWLLEHLVVQELPDAEPLVLTAKDADRAVAMLQHLPPAEFSDYSSWLRVGMALHHTDPGLLTAWVDWSRQMANFDEAECLRKWASFDKAYKGKRATIRTLHHLAKQHGYQEPKKAKRARKRSSTPAGVTEPDPSDDKPAASFDGMILKLPDGWNYPEEGPPTKSRLSHGALAGMLPRSLLRFNEVDLLPEVRTTSGWRSITEADQSDACVHLDQKGWIIGLDSLQMAVLHTARQQPFHPVRDYLLSIEQNPAIPAVDLDTVAPTFLRASQPLHVAMLRKWLIGAVARAIEPGCQMDYCLVLKGLQGIRKSTFFKTLASPAFHCSSVPEHELRFLLNVHSCWLFEFAELESVTSRKEVGRLKNLITTATDWIVPPYGRARQRMARASVFCGTVNEAEFLRDATGDRRFWVVPIDGIEAIDTDALEAARDGIWKAAIAAWRAGEKPVLSAEHAAESEEQNARFRIEDAWDGPIEDFLRLRLEADLLPVTIPDLFDALDIPKAQQSRDSTARVRTIAARLGWEKARLRPRPGEDPKQGLWPPDRRVGCTGVHSSDASQEAGSQRKEHEGCAQGGARANASQEAGSQQLCTPCTPFSPKGVTSSGEQGQHSSEPENSMGVLDDLGCTGCTAPESPSAAREEPVHRGGAQTRARVHSSATPSAGGRIPVCLRGEPGWSRSATARRTPDGSVMLTSTDGRQELAGWDEISDAEAAA